VKFDRFSVEQTTGETTIGQAVLSLMEGEALFARYVNQRPQTVAIYGHAANTKTLLREWRNECSM